MAETNCYRPENLTFVLTDTFYSGNSGLEELLGELVKKIVIGPEIVDWIIDALRESHRDEEAYHIAQIEGLQQKYLQLQDKMDRAYEDKLEGKISEEFWKRRSHEWREQQLRIRAAIKRHENANQFYFDLDFVRRGLLEKIILHY